MGITLEEIEVNASLPINPTIIRIMRVLRIARGETNKAELACVRGAGSPPGESLALGNGSGAHPHHDVHSSGINRQ